MDFIKEKGSANNSSLLEIAKANIKENSIALALYTDKIICDNFNGIEDIEHLLELRIFNDNVEFKAIRGSMEKDFIWRIIDDNDFKEKIEELEDSYIRDFNKLTLNETHYLDIDSLKSNGNTYFATGGGKYNLPVVNAEKIEIRNYISYDEQGLACIEDFRIVKFITKGGDK